MTCVRPGAGQTRRKRVKCRDAQTLVSRLILFALFAAAFARLAPDGFARAQPLAAERPGVWKQECSAAQPGRVKVTFLWKTWRSGTQFLNLSVFNNGFRPGTFVGAGPLTPSTWGYVWDGLDPNAPHTVRVNTLTPQGWFPGPSYQFATIDCGPTGFFKENHPPDAGMATLQQQLAEEIEASSFDAAVAVTDLQTGQTIAVNGDQPRLPGCSANFFVLLRAVMDLQEGRYPESWVGDLISSTIYSSNPVTARDVLKISANGDVAAGVRSVNELYALLGMKGSLYDHLPAYGFEYSLMGTSNLLTANDVNRALRALWEERVVSPEWRDYLLTKMTDVKPGLQYLIPAGVAADAVVSHKNGFFWESGWVDNDIGIVRFTRNGRTYAYAISFFTQWVPTKYADIPLGQTVSSLVWQYFEAKY